MDTFETVRQLIVDKFDKDPALVTLEASFESLEIDSLDFFDLIFDAEEKFGVKAPSDIKALNTVQDIVNLIDQLRAAAKKAD